MNPKIFRPSATPVALLPASIASSDGCALSIAILWPGCTCHHYYPIFKCAKAITAAATYVKDAFEMS